MSGLSQQATTSCWGSVSCWVVVVGFLRTASRHGNLLESSEQVANFARMSCHGPSPTAEAARRVDGLCTFVQITPFQPVLLGVLAVGVRYQKFAILEAHERLGLVLPHHAAKDGQHREA